MKRIKYFLQFLCIFLLLSNSIFAEQLSKTFYSNDFSLEPISNSSYRISMHDFGQLTQKGYPSLPSKTVFISLPNNAKVENIDITPGYTKPIPGNYVIKSTDILFPLDSQDDQITKILEDHLTKKKIIYAKNQFFPESSAKILKIDYSDNKPVVKIRYTPISYNPVENSLKITEVIHVTVNYSIDKTLISSSVKNTIHETNNISTTTSLLIISSETLRKVIQPFITWKQCLGIATDYVSVEWIEDNIEGYKQTVKIREFLKIKYASENIKNVLFIGDKKICPLQYLYPDPDNHSYSGCIASDMYFADLTSDWDSDGDKHFGEYEQDEIDWFPELNIGRIPWSDSSTVKTILTRIINYEKNNGSWKNNSMLVGSITNFKNEYNKGYPVKTDGAYLMEELKNNVFINNVSATFYEREGIDPSDFDSDFALNSNTIVSNWASEEYGCLTWWSHGNAESAERKWWLADDGDNVPENGEVRQQAFLHIYNIPNILNNHPVIFANSCYIGTFSQTGLGRKLIKDVSTGVIAASHQSWSTLGWKEIDAGGSSTLSYYFWEECIKNNKTVGEALKSAKIRYLEYFNDTWQHLNNVYTFNYFGDPTLKVSNVEPLYGAISGELVPASDTAAVAGIEITITELGRKTVTDEAGNYSFNYVPEGEYHLSAFAQKYEKNKKTYVRKGETVTADLNPIQSIYSLTTSDSVCSFILQEGESEVSNIMIKNDGNTLFKYRVAGDSENSSWLSIDTDSELYTVNPQHMDTLSFKISTCNLDQGKYKTSIYIHKDTTKTPFITIPVNLTTIDTIPPAPINDLSFTQMTDCDSVRLTWTAPGDNGLHGTAESYDIILCNKPFQNSGSSNIRYLDNSIIPQSPKNTEYCRVTSEIYKRYPYIIIRTWDEAGLSSLSNEIIISTTDIDEINESYSIPNDYIIQNYPNPFNMETTIEFGLSQSGNVNIRIFNERGQCVKHLVSNKEMNSGKHQVSWDATNKNNNTVPSGLYLYQIITDDNVFVKKMTLLK